MAAKDGKTQVSLRLGRGALADLDELAEVSFRSRSELVELLTAYSKVHGLPAMVQRQREEVAAGVDG